MRRMRLTIICILLLLLIPTVLPACADAAQAEDLTDRCSFDFGGDPNAYNRILLETTHAQSFAGGESFSLTWEEPMDGARLCLMWQTAPDNVRLSQYGADGALLETDTIDTFYETATALLPDARKAVVEAGENGMKVRSCAVYGAGELPEPFHAWQETPDHLDYLLISTHPDDDVLYLGSIVPTYGAEQGYVGSIVYVTKMRDENTGRVRISEAENGAWAMGLRYYPVFLNMVDVANNASAEKKKAFLYDDLLLNTVRIYRKLHPLVVFAQDLDGEYGHWQHKLTAKAAREAFALAADPTFDPESAEQYGTWQVQKLYLHLYRKYKLTVDAHAPLSFFDGKDAYEVACEAYKKHETQQRYRFKVRRDEGAYAFNRFGMAEGVVPVGSDVFDNIDETLLSGYVPPTPTPEPSETPEPEPSPTPASAQETPVQLTAAPCTPEPEPQPEAPDPAPLIWTGAVTVFTASVVGVAAYFWKKRRNETHPPDENAS